MENKQEFKKYFKKIFVEDFYIDKNFTHRSEVDENRIKFIVNTKSEFIFHISVVLLSKKIITNNKIPKNLKDGKTCYTLEDFSNEILLRKYSPSSYNSRKNILAKLISEILELDLIEFTDYSDEVYKNLLNKLLEISKIENNYDHIKNKKRKDEKELYTEKDLGDFLKM